jgi:hypothetical protein
MKPTPLRPARLPDSGGIFFCERSPYGGDIAFDRKVKQEKKLGADCTCPYSPYGHVEGRTILLTWQFDDVVIVGWMFVSELEIDTCPLWPIRCGRVAQPFGATCHCFTGLYGWFIIV